MIILRNILLVFLAMALFVACGNANCVKGEGEPEHRTLDVASFDGILVEGPIDIRLHRSENQIVEIEGQSNILDLIETQVNAGVWSIRTRQCFKTRKDIIVHISVPTINKISIEGSGDVVSEDQFDTDELVLAIAGSGDLSVIVNASKVSATIKGSGDMQIMGMCQEFTSAIHGSGDIKAADLQSSRAKAEIIGSGDINLHVTDALEANVTGSGDIRYKGDPPSVNRNVTGSGSISER